MFPNPAKTGGIDADCRARPHVFADAGVVPAGPPFADLPAPVPGKQIVIFGLAAVMVRAGLTSLPQGAGRLHVCGVSCLAAIGAGDPGPAGYSALIRAAARGPA